MFKPYSSTFITPINNISISNSKLSSSTIPSNSTSSTSIPTLAPTSTIQTQSNPQLHTSNFNPNPFPLTPSTTTVIWYRDDLRLHDHPALYNAVENSHQIAPLILLPSSPSKFWLESVQSLRHAFRKRGAEIYVRPIWNQSVIETVIQFCQQVHATRLHVHSSISKKDRELEQFLSQRLQKLSITMHTFWTGCLHNPQQFPCNISDLPDDCDEFEKVVKKLDIPQPLAAPQEIRPITTWVDPGLLPSTVNDENKNSMIHGGEQVGLQKVNDYVDGKQMASVSNGGQILGNRSQIDTKFGRLDQFLTVGCISPRLLYHQVVQKVSNCSLRRYCVELELILRDFVRFMTLKHGTYSM